MVIFYTNKKIEMVSFLFDLLIIFFFFARMKFEFYAKMFDLKNVLLHEY